MKYLMVSITLALQGCAVIAEYPMTSIGVATIAVTGKGVADNAASYVSNYDCNSLNVLSGDYYCYKPEPVLVVDRSVRPAAKPIKPKPLY